MWMKERIGRGYTATIPLSMVDPINYAMQREVSA